MKIMLTVPSEKKSLTADIQGTNQVVIGRRDVDTGASPTIDLSPFQALEQGVSRHHAALFSRHNTIQIVDLGSQNGTYVNEVRLYPSQPRRLQDGDIIRLAHLTLYIQMTDMPQTAA